MTTSVQPRTGHEPTSSGLAAFAGELRTGCIGVLWATSQHMPPDWRCILNAEEQARAGRFLVERAFREFVLGRLLLRLGLAAHLGGEPQAFQIQALPNQKPFLINGPENFDFNITHSGGMAACAFHTQGAVGIDMEAGHQGLEVEALVNRLLSESESALYAGLAGAAKFRFFFDVWRAKEAIVKAAGLGLSVDFRQFDTHDAQGRLERVALHGTTWHLGILEDGPCGPLTIAHAQ